uniref:Putative APC amino acid permease n=1 Tax=Moniliophthora roreri TaxID=221103 RepID=A0A0W0FUX8_MONRR
MSAMKGKELEPTAESSKEVDLDAALLAALGYKQASVASIEWGCAVQVMAAASIGTGFETTNAQTFGVYCALIVVHGIINTFSPKVIARLQTLFITLNVVLCCIIIIALPAATPKELRNSASIAFGQFSNLSGWSNGFAFILSLLTPAWTAGCFDAPIHMSEEARNAVIAIPWTIILSTGSTLVLGWAINIALAFSMGSDTEGIIDSPVGQPMATILLRSLGMRGSLAVWSVVVVVQFAIGISQLTACSRQVFAFCRDGALPFSKWTYYVDPRTHAPTHAVWLSAVLSILLGALAFAGPNAINAVFSLVITGQYAAYGIPIVARWLGGRDFKAGPVSFGAWSLPIAITAVLWMTFMSIIVMFPADPDPGVSEMNYTVVVHAGVLFLATFYYFFPYGGGMYWFEGPRATIQVDYEVENDENHHGEVLD